ncbi:hypothetical protein HW555_014341, partial [Spodoptera exigua]
VRYQQLKTKASILYKEITMVLVLKGKLVITIEEEVNQLSSGELFVVNAGDTADLTSDLERTCSYLTTPSEEQRPSELSSKTSQLSISAEYSEDEYQKKELIIHVGSWECLASKKVQTEILELKKQIGIKYISVHSLFTHMPLSFKIYEQAKMNSFPAFEEWDYILAFLMEAQLDVFYQLSLVAYRAMGKDIKDLTQKFFSCVQNKYGTIITSRWKDLLKLATLVDGFGFWLNIELYEQNTQKRPLKNDGLELFHYYSGKRPVYFCLWLARRMKGTILSQGEEYLLTYEAGNYQLLLFNTNYFDPHLSSEEAFLKSQAVAFELELIGIASEHYQVKQIDFNRHSGALFYMYEEFRSAKTLDLETQEYIVEQTRPKIKVFDTEIIGAFNYYKRIVTREEGTNMSIYDYQVKTTKDETVSLEDYRGKVLLIVNTATGCGFTPQYEGLEKLYKKYQEQGLEILDFPCNQFGHQAPGTNEEISDFCQMTYQTTFQTFGKIDVNGEHADPLYDFLKGEKGGLLGGAIKWNFTKFLVDRDGKVVKRFAPTVEPEKIAGDIEKLL